MLLLKSVSVLRLKTTIKGRIRRASKVLKNKKQYKECLYQSNPWFIILRLTTKKKMIQGKIEQGLKIMVYDTIVSL